MHRNCPNTTASCRAVPAFDEKWTHNRVLSFEDTFTGDYIRERGDVDAKTTPPFKNIFAGFPVRMDDGRLPERVMPGQLVHDATRGARGGETLQDYVGENMTEISS